MRYQSSPFIPQERQETTRERAERQRQERRAELTYTESDEKRWAENRERVLRERQQAADSAKNNPEDEPILKSSLKQSKPLNDLAAGKFNALKKGSTETEEIKKVQQALIDCGFDLGSFGADGDFGRATEGAVKQFQTHYKPTHTTHKSYQFGDVDGIVGKNTILALDEAVKEGWKYEEPEVCNWADSSFGKTLGFVESKNDYSAYNRTKGGLKAFFNTNLTQLTVSDVMKNQKERSMFAVGRFQVIPSTLNEAVESLSIDKQDLFDKKVQDRIFNEYIIKKKRPQIISYLEGSGSVEDAMYAWAKEFASAGVEKGKKISGNRTAKGGESYYSGDGLNKAHLSPEEMKETLIQAKRDSISHD